MKNLFFIQKILFAGRNLAKIVEPPLSNTLSMKKFSERKKCIALMKAFHCSQELFSILFGPFATSSAPGTPKGDPAFRSRLRFGSKKMEKILENNENFHENDSLFPFSNSFH